MSGNQRRRSSSGTKSDAHDRATERSAVETDERRLRELRVLYQSSLVFSQSRDPARVGKHIIETVERLVDYQRGSIWLIDENRSGLELLAHTDLGLIGEELEKEL